ncbi:MAG: hypothetical protein WCJ51_01190 [Candidatus Moraniibacteriota bacterium]
MPESKTKKIQKKFETAELKKMVSDIRHRVHYVDKNDFAKKAVSVKDKVYDFDLRKDLACFLEKGEICTVENAQVLSREIESEFERFENLVEQAIVNAEIAYLVYGDKTYVEGKMSKESEQLMNFFQNSISKQQ